MYYIESKVLTAGGDWADATLSMYENKYEFVQGFQRAWVPMRFKTKDKAIAYARLWLTSRNPIQDPISFRYCDDDDHMYGLNDIEVWKTSVRIVKEGQE
jgi:hypothetical protein